MHTPDKKSEVYLFQGSYKIAEMELQAISRLRATVGLRPKLK